MLSLPLFAWFRSLSLLTVFLFVILVYWHSGGYLVVYTTVLIFYTRKCIYIMDDPARDLEKPAPSHSSDTRHDADSVSRPVSLSDPSSASSRFQSLDDDYMSRIQTAQTQRSNALERDPTTMSRIATHRSQHSATVGASLRARPSKSPLPDFGAGKPYPPMLPSMEDYVVEFAGLDDPLHPQNWSTKKK